MKMLRIKNTVKHVSLGLILIMSLSGCGNDDVLLDDAQFTALRALIGDWDLGNGSGYIRLDDVDVSANYEGFSLFYADRQYRTTNAADLFRATGTWEWVDEEATTVRLDDGKEITILLLTENRFTFSFNLAGTSQRAGLPGNYVISVVR